METYRYDYGGPYKTEARAESALEDMFAAGEVCTGEDPQIERRGGKTASWSPARYRWYVTCRGN